MKLIEIKGLFDMDTGAPSPTIISNDNSLYLSFYARRHNSLSKPIERNPMYDTGIVVLNFDLCLKYYFGSPGNETIAGHPYHKFGLNSYSFYEVRNSELILELQEIDKSHSYYNPKKWESYHHYILTFHDNMFECVAKGFEIREEDTSIHDQTSSILNELSALYI